MANWLSSRSARILSVVLLGQIAVFYGLLSDLLELTSGVKQPALRNPLLSKELEALSKAITPQWVMRAIAGFDDLHAGARRNLNRQLGLDALAASLAK